MNESAPHIQKQATVWAVASQTSLGSRYLLPPLLVLLVLVGVGWFVQHVVENAAQQRLNDSLKAILEADIGKLRLWVEAKCTAAEQIAHDDEVWAQCTQVLEESQKGAGWEQRVLESDMLKNLRAVVTPRLQANDFSGFSVIRLDGVFVARLIDEGIGKIPWRIPDDYAPPLQAGKTVLTRPFLTDDGPADTGNLQDRIRPTVMVLAPVYNTQHQQIGTIAMRFDDARKPLALSRPGETGETIAFDSTGTFISRSRFEDEARALGLLTPRESSVLNLRFSDPGANLLAGKRPLAPRGKQPLVHMAQSILKQAQSSAENTIEMDVDGDRDYRGVPVVGAGTWLQDLSCGVVTKMDVAEAYRPVVVLRYAFYSIFGVLVVAVGGFLMSRRKLEKMDRRLNQAMQQLKKMGQYTLVEKIGQGGMGEVYRASHAMLRRPTAIKVLTPATGTPEDLARFEREVQCTSQLTNPHTITIYDYGHTPEGAFYYAMEYLKGVNLHYLVLKAGTLPERRSIYLLRQACSSLSEAHGMNLIHRDIKPANLMLCTHGGVYDFVKVLDFGLVKLLQRDTPVITNPNLMVGTPQYVAPEGMKSGGVVDKRSDLYSLGAVGYFLLTGVEPFQGDTVIEVATNLLNGKIIRPSERLKRPVANDLEECILRCLAKNPEERYQSVEELDRALAGCHDAGKWTQSDARTWWTANGTLFENSTGWQ